MQALSLEDFNYELPEELIAQEPLPQRSSSRLLVRQSNGSLEHQLFKNLARILPPGTRLLYNDTRVIPGRLRAHTKHGGRIELMLLKPLSLDENRWQVLGKPFRKLLPGTELVLDETCRARIEAQFTDTAQATAEVSFSLPYSEFLGWMDRVGYIPLPPYIARREANPAPLSEDRERYQTIYAQEQGSVAAPTAGLHFSHEIWQELRDAGIVPVPLTLHVGGGTFLPVKTTEIAAHVMHTERYRMSSKSWEELENAQRIGLPLIAVGTTSLRCLESFVRQSQRPGVRLEDQLDRWLETDLFLYPKHKEETIKPWGLSGLITNFHQPESSLLMLVSALIGYQSMRDLYKTAVAEQYRFLSYGDASLLMF